MRTRRMNRDGVRVRGHVICRKRRSTGRRRAIDGEGWQLRGHTLRRKSSLGATEKAQRGHSHIAFIAKRCHSQKSSSWRSGVSRYLGSFAWQWQASSGGADGSGGEARAFGVPPRLRSRAGRAARSRACEGDTRTITWAIHDARLNTKPPHRPTPAPVPLVAMSGVEGVRADKARRGPARTAGRLRRGRRPSRRPPPGRPGPPRRKP